MKASLYTVFFAAALGAVCAGMLAWVGDFTRPYWKANEQAEEVRNILGVLEIPHDKEAEAKALIEVFEQNVREGEHRALSRAKRAASGKAGRSEGLRFYAYTKNGSLATVAVAFKGQGVWGPIEGFLALGPDLLTVSGVTFHKQEETPGLGGEIASDGFRGQFPGKSIRRADGSPGIRIVKGGGSSGPSEVDAISGATMTCQKVEGMLTSVMASILADFEALKAAVEKVIRSDNETNRDTQDGQDRNAGSSESCASLLAAPKEGDGNAG